MKEGGKYRRRRSVIIIVLLLIFMNVTIYSSIFLKLKEGTILVVEEEEMTEEMVYSEEVPIIKKEPVKDDVFNVLLIGIDGRGVNAQTGRSDVMMVVSLNATDGKATIMSFLRDSLVDVAGYGMTRLGHSFQYGGAGLTINTINQTYGLDIQYYMTINFDGLEHVIDRIGGIEVYLTAEEAAFYRNYGFTGLHEGTNVLNGAQALRHARNRSLDSDFGRTRRQRRVIEAVYNKMMQNGDAEQLLTLIDYGLTQVRTNMDAQMIFGMSKKVMNIKNLQIQQTSIPTNDTYTSERYNGMSILRVDVEANKEIIQELIY